MSADTMSLSHRLSWLCVGFVSICMLGTLYTPQRALAQPSVVPGGAIDLMVPQFVAEAVGFKAIDETGYDWPYSSDEVYAVFSDLNPTLFDLLTATYEDVDTGESQTFGPNERCIAPRPSCDHGVSEILHFQVSLWESDWTPPTNAICYGDKKGLHVFLRRGHCPYDDLIGRGEVLMSREQLLDALPRVGDSVDFTLLLGEFCGPTMDECGDAGTTLYELTYRIRRLDDVRRPLVIASPRTPM
jgi:hypothetical protein